MDRFLPLLLEVWQQACRNIHIDASVEAIAGVLARRLPLVCLLIRQLDPAGGQLVTLACAGPRPSSSSEDERPSRREAERLRAWCATQQVLRGAAGDVRRQMPGLLPADLSGGTLAAGLAREGQVFGAVLLVADHTEDLSAAHEPLLAALLDPLAVAVQNDRLIRELSALREAAEADRASLLARLGRQLHRRFHSAQRLVRARRRRHPVPR